MTNSFRRKKQRGWRRRVRELEAWAAGHATVNLDHLDRDGYESAEFWFERWPRPLPGGICRRVVGHLVDIHDRWRQQLQTHPGPVYLGIWLFEPALTESQVVAAVGESARAYETRHDPAKRSAAPPVLYQDIPDALGRFEWTRDRWVDRERLSDFAESDHTQVLRAADRVERIGDDVFVLFNREVWRARLPVEAG